MKDEPMTEKEVVALMKTSQTSEEWDANCDKVKDSHSGHYPRFWFGAIVLSGLVTRVAARWGGTGEITISQV